MSVVQKVRCFIFCLGWQPGDCYLKVWLKPQDMLFEKSTTIIKSYTMLGWRANCGTLSKFGKISERMANNRMQISLEALAAVGDHWKYCYLRV